MLNTIFPRCFLVVDIALNICEIFFQKTALAVRVGEGTEYQLGGTLRGPTPLSIHLPDESHPGVLKISVVISGALAKSLSIKYRPYFSCFQL